MAIRLKPRPNERAASCVYVIESGPRIVKVGIAGRPQTRLNALSTASASRLELVGSIKVGKRRAFKIERLAHQMMEPLRLRGEWFRCYGEDAWMIVQLLACDPPRFEDAHAIVRLQQSYRMNSEEAEDEAAAECWRLGLIYGELGVFQLTH